MKLAEICEELTYTCLQGEMEKEISDIIYDSRKVEKDTVFVCMVGAVVDGHDFVEDAVKKGAAALVVEHAVETDIPENCTVLQVEDARYALAIMSAAFFGHPDRELTKAINCDSICMALLSTALMSFNFAVSNSALSVSSIT